MKIRTGFVSNSSSSSFVVAFPREPKSVEDVKEMLFAKGQHDFIYPYNDLHDDYIFWSVDKVAETVWNDIQKQKANNKEKIVESISDGWFDSRPDYDDFKDENGKTDWEAYEKETVKRSKEAAKKFIDDNKDAVIYVFEYSDNDGQYGCALEHGNLFRKLKHIRTSYH